MRSISFASLVTGAAVTVATLAQATSPAAGTVNETFEVQEHTNIAYRDAAPAELLPLGRLVDVYLPKGARDFPVLMLVHGGGWMGGDKVLGLIPDVARCFARQGVGVVAVNYRLSPFVRHPAHVSDVAKAFAWAHSHIARYGGRPDRIFAFGHSAGGHLVSLLATDLTYLNQEGLPGDVIKGVVSVSGVYEISKVRVNFGVRRPRLQLDLGVRANPYALAFGGDEDVARQASPITHVREGLPPFIVAHAQDDLPTLSEMAVDFHAALAANKCDATLLRVADRNHVTVLWRATNTDDPVVTASMKLIRGQQRLAMR